MAKLASSPVLCLVSTLALGCGSEGGSRAAGGGSAGMAAGGAATAGQGGLGAMGGEPGELDERTSAELLASLKIGWNLGNSLDAPEGETAWGNPPASAALFQAVAAAGFGIVRIPVTWSLHSGPGPSYTIDETFLSRVEEVVGLATDSGLYAIINLHHDGADAYAGVEWLTLNAADGSVTEANDAAVRERFVAVWTQLAARFAGHGEKLLFESMNEIHDGYDAPDPRYYTIINELNQAFVDTVRGSGEANARRHLIVPGYNTNIDFTVAGFEPPTDPTPARLILSVHYYDPWTYAGEGSTHVWGQASPGTDSWGQEPHVVGQFDKLKTSYVDNGLPVLMGEYGAVHQAGFEDYRRYYMEYVGKAAAERGILPVYWDNGGTASGMDGFGLFDRTSNDVLHPTILEAMMRAVSSSHTLVDVAAPTP